MQLYFRHRHNGAIVYRMEVANRQRRIELNQIAVVTKTGEIVPHKRRQPTDAETAEITKSWLSWKARADAGELSESEQFLAELNRFTDWMQRRAGNDEVDAISDPMLMALLDLRQVIVRRLSSLPGDDDDIVNDDPPVEDVRKAAEG